MAQTRSASTDECMRIALIGKTGCGKSALGNTLLGQKVFVSSPQSESVTNKCQRASCDLPTGEKLVVVDTPGLMDTRDRNVHEEVAKAIAYLSPGPNAFLLVLEPNRATKEEVSALQELKQLFGEQSFLNYTIMVMVRKNDQTNHDDEPIDIEQFINTMSCKEVKELYLECGKRAVAVENKDTLVNKNGYKAEIIEMVKTIGGYYSHAYFHAVQQNKELMRILNDLMEKQEKERTEFQQQFRLNRAQFEEERRRNREREHDLDTHMLKSEIQSLRDIILKQSESKCCIT